MVDRNCLHLFLLQTVFPSFLIAMDSCDGFSGLGSICGLSESIEYLSRPFWLLVSQLRTQVLYVSILLGVAQLIKTQRQKLGFSLKVKKVKQPATSSYLYLSPK